MTKLTRDPDLDGNYLSDKGNHKTFVGRIRSRRRTSSLQPIGNKLRGTGVLAALLQQTDKLVFLNRMMRAYLPPHLQDHARIVALEPQQWIVKTDSAAWATRLRYVLPELRRQLSIQLKQEVPTLKLRVEPVQKPQSPPPRRLTLTTQGADAIEGAANAVNDDRLGEALLRLAAHARKAS